MAENGHKKSDWLKYYGIAAVITFALFSFASSHLYNLQYSERRRRKEKKEKPIKLTVSIKEVGSKKVVNLEKCPPVITPKNKECFKSEIERIYKIYNEVKRKVRLPERLKPFIRWLDKHLPYVICAIWGAEASWRFIKSSSDRRDWCPLQVNRRTWEDDLYYLGVVRNWKDILKIDKCLSAALYALLKNVTIFCSVSSGSKYCSGWMEKGEYLNLVAAYHTPRWGKNYLDYLNRVKLFYNKCRKGLKLPNVAYTISPKN